MNDLIKMATRGQVALLRLNRMPLNAISLHFLDQPVLASGDLAADESAGAVAANSAVFGFPEINHGRLRSARGTQRLPRLIGTSRVFDLICSGRIVDATEAKDVGLVDEVVADGTLLDTALIRANRFVGYSPMAIASAKRAVHSACDTPVADGPACERKPYWERFGSAASPGELESRPMRPEPPRHAHGCTSVLGTTSLDDKHPAAGRRARITDPPHISKGRT